MPFRAFLCASLPFLLAACGEAPPALQPERDPAMVAALGDRLMTDPDLVGQNRATNAALLPDEDGSIPVEDDSPREIAAARAKALALVGGPGRMERAPAPDGSAEAAPYVERVTAAARAAASPGGRAECSEMATYTAAWAARMPETFPVYPRAAVQEAAGTDSGRCALRAVSFTTPVPLGEVIDFYFTRAGAAGLSVRHTVAGGETMLGGTSGERSFTLYARRRSDGLTSVDLVTNGG